MKLELKHLTPYLPYGLKLMYGCVMDSDNDQIDTMTVDNIHDPLNGYGRFVVQPILKPLSDLTKDNNDIFEMIEEYSNGCIRWILVNELNECKYYTIELLLQTHFDVFGLIEKGLAIDINTLENE